MGPGERKEERKTKQHLEAYCRKNWIGEVGGMDKSLPVTAVSGVLCWTASRVLYKARRG
jgi:hypothetical protein